MTREAVHETFTKKKKTVVLTELKAFADDIFCLTHITEFALNCEKIL